MVLQEYDDPGISDMTHYGPTHETYFVLKGRLRLTWDGGVLEAGANEAVYLAPGFNYELRCIGDESAYFLWSMTLLRRPDGGSARSDERPAASRRVMLGQDQARAVVDAALEHARRIEVPVSVAVVDAGRELLAFDRMDGALLISIETAIGKAYAARSLNKATADVGPDTQPGTRSTDSRSPLGSRS